MLEVHIKLLEVADTQVSQKDSDLNLKVNEIIPKTEYIITKWLKC